jgi:hypothetical protein
MMKKCFSCFRKQHIQKKLDSQGKGYSVEKFCEDGLVPVWGYASWKPLDAAKRQNVADRLKVHNERLTDRMRRKQAAAGREDEKVAPKVDPLPLEVICLVWLWKTEVEVLDARQTFDFNQEASLRVKVSGALNFPPDQEPKDPKAPASKDPAFKRPGDAPDTRWRLEIVVTAVLKVHEESDSFQVGGTVAPDTSNTKLKVKCEKLDIQRDVKDLQGEMLGDPMVDSWLPVNDILEDIEIMLENNLQRVIQGLQPVP